MTDWAFHFR